MPAAQRATAPLIGFSPQIAADSRDLKAFLFQNVYNHPRVDDDNQRAVDWMCQLFQHFIRNPDSLPPTHRDRIPDVGLHRTVADHVAGMTDRFAIEQFQQFVYSDSI